MHQGKLRWFQIKMKTELGEFEACPWGSGSSDEVYDGPE
jgi:hypothetical protein